MLAYLIPTIIYMIVMYRQFTIIIESPKGDPYIKSKVAFLIHSIANLAGIWLLLYRYKYEALVFFTIVSLIALYAYSEKK
jgi:hypothetical protein